MATRSFDQAFRVLELIREKNPSSEKLQELYSSGLLSDLFDGNIGQANRDEVRKVLGLPPLHPGLNIWKTITLGLHGSPKAYRKALESAGFRIGDYAGQILNKISVAKTTTEVDLVRVTVAELGFKNGARRDAIYARAIELGLELCPAEVGPALRLVYQESSWIRVGMEPITDSDGYLLVFIVAADSDGRWLDSHYGKPAYVCDAAYRWVFVRPRK